MSPARGGEPLHLGSQAREVVGGVPLAEVITRPGSLAEHFEGAVRSRLSDVELGAWDERIVTWLSGWDAETVGAVCSLLDRVRQAGALASAEPDQCDQRGTNADASHRSSATDAPCEAWNDAHTCDLPIDHPGDHVCRGCRDRWNRHPEDETDEWDRQRPDPDERCPVTTIEGEHR